MASRKDTAPKLGPEVQYRKTSDLIPYARNARVHTANQIAQIKALIVEYGWTAPVLADRDGIVAGHGRVSAANELYEAGLTLRLPGGAPIPPGTVPVIDCTGWSATQRRGYIIADNKSALNAGWDTSILQLELADLVADDFDLGLVGFSEGELAELIDGGEGEATRRYAQTVNTPIYEPKGEQPETTALADPTKTDALAEAIREATDITEDERTFLLRAAARHTVFDYHLIAEYYCHASPAMQSLMEDSALIIIDFENAIDRGFVRMTQRLAEVFAQSGLDGADEEDDDGDAQ